MTFFLMGSTQSPLYRCSSCNAQRVGMEVVDNESVVLAYYVLCSVFGHWGKMVEAEMGIKTVVEVVVNEIC